MSQTNDTSYTITFTSSSSLKSGLQIHAAVGDGPSHPFLVDTGSVGMLVPRCKLGKKYQNFDPSQDIEFQFVSDGNTYWGQWVNVPVVLGVPANWDRTGDYPIAQVDVFAVDRVDPPRDFDGGMLGIGFAIGGKADGGPARNPLLHLTYKGTNLSAGYIISSSEIELGLTSTNSTGFSFIQLKRNSCDSDWMQPQGSLGLIKSQGDSPFNFQGDLPVLMDTGIDYMILWLRKGELHPNVVVKPFPSGVTISISAPATNSGLEPVLQYSFTTGVTGQPMEPSDVVCNIGTLTGINTGANVLAGADYLYDSHGGQIGFRVVE